MLAVLAGSVGATARPEAGRPNILLCVADDWGWPHAGAYGDDGVKTPAFDRIAREGILFDQAAFFEHLIAPVYRYEGTLARLSSKGERSRSVWTRSSSVTSRPSAVQP